VSTPWKAYTIKKPGTINIQHIWNGLHNKQHRYNQHSAYMEWAINVTVLHLMVHTSMLQDQLNLNTIQLKLLGVTLGKSLIFYNHTTLISQSIRLNGTVRRVVRLTPQSTHHNHHSTKNACPRPPATRRRRGAFLMICFITTTARLTLALWKPSCCVMDFPCSSPTS